MRPQAFYALIGVLFIVAGALMINQGFTGVQDNGETTMSGFALRSASFAHNASIPAQNTCDGAETSPPLSISGAPVGTRAFALIVEDPDVPKDLKPDGVFVHWVLFNIPGSITEITEGAHVGVPGGNSIGKPAYTGPCPPAGSEHRYIFTLYALDVELTLPAGSAKGQVLKAIEGHILGKTQLVGVYKRI